MIRDHLDFMLEYTFQVLEDKDNWSNITAVSLALVDADTLTYEKVCEVVEHDRSNAVLK